MIKKTIHKKWFVVPKHRPHASLRLFCFPYAGGSFHTYRDWVNHLPDFVELIVVQPPGRGERILETPYTDMESLIEDLWPEIQLLLDKPYVLFGHSMGCRIAFELMMQAKGRGKSLPCHFIGSGSPAPGSLLQERKIHDLPDDEFIDELKDLNGTPSEILDNEEIMEFYLPLLKADFALVETYQVLSPCALDCPSTLLLGGQDHRVKRAPLEDWNAYFKTPPRVHWLDGDHFFIDRYVEDVQELVCAILSDASQQQRRKDE